MPFPTPGSLAGVQIKLLSCPIFYAVSTRSASSRRMLPKTTASPSPMCASLSRWRMRFPTGVNKWTPAPSALGLSPRHWRSCGITRRPGTVPTSIRRDQSRTNLPFFTGQTFVCRRRLRRQYYFIASASLYPYVLPSRLGASRLTTNSRCSGCCRANIFRSPRWCRSRPLPASPQSGRTQVVRGNASVLISSASRHSHDWLHPNASNV
ncbi:hypothetical protein DFH07DRAFT_153562 [Mycena maculata]|uniref:Uncharacterized protein n=1 Tax=Mycena maculata TaxID=230809 RepID=A0AAD7MUD8_9AGAR|nr:hypothetical protein DFH07DRAFT_153562 [Mycena maculata]